MQYISNYTSPIGSIVLASNETELIGLWFEGQKYFAQALHTDYIEKELPIFTKAKEWLDIYFSGNKPDFTPPLHLEGTAFQIDVWNILASVPYGQTITYGEIAKQLMQKRGVPRMSAQAVGGAVGRNKISIFIPCHRVIGSNNSLTGYAAGIDKKIELLKLEKANMPFLFRP